MSKIFFRFVGEVTWVNKIYLKKKKRSEFKNEQEYRQYEIERSKYPRVSSVEIFHETVCGTEDDGLKWAKKLIKEYQCKYVKLNPEVTKKVKIRTKLYIMAFTLIAEVNSRPKNALKNLKKINH